MPLVSTNIFQMYIKTFRLEGVLTEKHSFDSKSFSENESQRLPKSVIKTSWGTKIYQIGFSEQCKLYLCSMYIHSKCMPQANITIKCYEYFSNTNILGEKIPVTNFNQYHIFVGDCVTFIFLAYQYKNDSHKLQLHAVLLSLCTYI